MKASNKEKTVELEKVDEHLKQFEDKETLLMNHCGEHKETNNSLLLNSFMKKMKDDP